MGRKKLPGLQKRFGVWHIDKKIFGRRVCESTGTGNLETAERILARKIEELRKVKFYGDRPKRVFKEAAIKFLKENQHLASLREYALHIKILDPFIGNSTIESIHMGSLQEFITARKQQGVKNRTINYSLQTVRRILNLAASEWLDDTGLTWLQNAPKIKLLKEVDKREPYPISWEEQEKLLSVLPIHQKYFLLFAVNTGCRERVLRELRWEWEIRVPELDTSVFVVPGYVFEPDDENNSDATRQVKNGEDRLVILNDDAKSVIDAVRGQHPIFVFTYRGKPITTGLNNTAWQNARKKVGLDHVRIHDLKHTFGRRLRSAGVGIEDRKDLLGHKSQGHITTHYSAAELEKLLEAANNACDKKLCGTLLRTVKQLQKQKSHLRIVS